MMLNYQYNDIFNDNYRNIIKLSSLKSTQSIKYEGGIGMSHYVRIQNSNLGQEII